MKVRIDRISIRYTIPFLFGERGLNLIAYSDEPVSEKERFFRY